MESIRWSIEKKTQDCNDLVDIELKLIEYFNKFGFGFFSVENKTELIDLEARKRLILLDHEHAEHQQSRAVWLTCGDDNTAFFHKYPCFRKHVNSIWKIEDDGGTLVEGFDDIAGVGVKHFESLFKENKNLFLPDILKIAVNIPSFVFDEVIWKLCLLLLFLRFILLWIYAKITRVWALMGSLLRFIGPYLMFWVQTLSKLWMILVDLVKFLLFLTLP